MISPAAKVGHGRWSRTLPPMVSLETLWKVAFIGTPHILIRGPWGRQNYVNITVLVWSSFGGLRGLLSRCAGTSVVDTEYHQWKFIDGVVDSGGQFISCVVDTVEQFIGGVVDTGDNIFPRCRWYRSEITKKPKIYHRCQQHRRKTVQRTTPPINLSVVSLTPAIRLLYVWDMWNPYTEYRLIVF